MSHEVMEVINKPSLGDNVASIIQPHGFHLGRVQTVHMSLRRNRHAHHYKHSSRLTGFGTLRQRDIQLLTDEVSGEGSEANAASQTMRCMMRTPSELVPDLEMVSRRNVRTSSFRNAISGNDGRADVNGNSSNPD